VFHSRAKCRLAEISDVPKYWRISDRAIRNGQPSSIDRGRLTFWIADNHDGAAVVNLTYRTTALYSRRDAVSGASAGLKHFGTRRLGRSDLATDPPLSTTLPRTDNV